jgi:predicted enzyme related to lactoylglutathione lyase
MAVRTSDIETVYRRLEQLGARILLEPMKSPDGRQAELVVHDPDGVRIHVVQRPDS